jgi:hypothetical protein
MEEQLVTIETYQFLPQAEAAKLQLEGNNIQVFLADAETVNMDWLLGNAIGNIKLQVPRDQVDKALAVLEEMRDKANQRPDKEEDDEDSDGAVCLACGAKLPEGAARCPSCGWTYASDGNGATAITTKPLGAAHAVSGQDEWEVEDKPIRISLLRVLKDPFFWLYVTLAFLLVFLLLSAAINWMLRARG